MQASIERFLFRLKRISRRPPRAISKRGGVPEELAIEIDRNGSPVSKRPSEWFVCFVPGLQEQWWHRFTNPRHQHVFALKMVEGDQWIIFEPWWTRIMVTTLGIDEAVKFLRWAAAGSILRVRESIPGTGSQTRGWANCAVLVSLMLGRPYWTWTPHGLYKRLSAENDVESVELADFLEEKLISMTRKIAADSLGDVFALAKLSPDAAFMELGRRISKIMFSPTFISLYRLAVSETARFPAAAGDFFTHGPHQAVASLKALIAHFSARGQFRDCDQERTSRAFLAMLRGNLFLEIVLGCRAEPNERDLESHTKSVVEIFLHGADALGKVFDAHNTGEDMQVRGREIAA